MAVAISSRKSLATAFGLLCKFYTHIHSNQGIYTPSEHFHRQVEAIEQVLYTYSGHAVREEILPTYNKYSIEF
jgi:hypothetical protein